MDFNHVYDLHHLLSGRRTPLPTAEILNSLEVKRATFDRIRAFMVACICRLDGSLGGHSNTRGKKEKK